MYTLTNIDFSNWSVVSELLSDEETVDANQAIPSDFASASSPVHDCRDGGFRGSLAPANFQRQP